MTLHSFHKPTTSISDFELCPVPYLSCMAECVAPRARNCVGGSGSPDTSSTTTPAASPYTLEACKTQPGLALLHLVSPCKCSCQTAPT